MMIDKARVVLPSLYGVVEDSLNQCVDVQARALYKGFDVAGWMGEEIMSGVLTITNTPNPAVLVYPYYSTAEADSHSRLTASLRSAQFDHARVSALSKRLIDGINSKVEHVYRNGDPNGYPGCVNLSFAYVEGESLLMALKVSPAR